MESIWSEIKNDFYDEDDDSFYIDSWLTDDADEDGQVIAKINASTKEVTYLDERAKTDEYAVESINEVLNQII